jgi:hypothetical protein
MEIFVGELVLPDVRRDIKSDATPLEAWAGPEGSRRLRHMKVERLLYLRTGRLYPRQEIFLIFISVRC